jgi:cation:H+ antiporter
MSVLGLSSLIAPHGINVPAAALEFDIPVMIAVALACLPVFISGREIARWEGGVFLLYYVAYVTYLILASQDHSALEKLSGVMLGFVIPITLITLVVSVFRRAPR